MPDDAESDDELDDPGVNAPSEENVPDAPVLSLEGNGEEFVPVVSEDPDTPPADVPEESAPEDDVPAVPDVPALSVFPLIPLVDDESSCDEVPIPEESPDELIPDDVPVVLAPVPVSDAAHAVAPIRHAAHARGMIHFFSIAIAAPLRYPRKS